MKPELLAPAGNLTKLKLAFYYGADAVYLGGKSFSLRTFADNFTDEELAEGIAYAHARGKKVYVAANIFARNADFPRLEAHFRLLETLKADAVLISDPGVFALARRVAPTLPIHISTQANTLNAEAARFWQSLGASRIVLARELTLKEISEIHAACPNLELEAFVHGAMCISYSGRCYLSDYMDGRPANRGACVQACRRAYRIQTKEGASDDFYDVEEDGKLSYVMNSKDLNMSGLLKELAAAGVCSFKIEGRMKGEFYLASVVNAYRRILDMGWANSLSEELLACPHRPYITSEELNGGVMAQATDSSQTGGKYDFIGIVADMVGGKPVVEMRTRFFEGDELEILSPTESFGKKFCVKNLCGPDGLPCVDAKLVQALYTFDCPFSLHKGDILRRVRCGDPSTTLRVT